MIEFFIPFEVKPKQGDRSAVVNGHVRHYQPKKVTSNANALVLLSKQYRPTAPLVGPLRLELMFYSAWRKADSKKVRAAGKAWHDTKPDWDNMCKQLCDVLQSAGFYANDSQLADISVKKLRTDSPGVFVRLGVISGNGDGI